MRQSGPSVDVVICVSPGLLVLEFGKCLYPVNGEALGQGFSKGVPRHTSVPREKVLGKCEQKKKVCVLNI
jgi:hypothetical protein